MDDSFCFYCDGLSFTSEEEAWDSFYKHCEHTFEWIKGVKVWRTAPSFFLETAFEGDEKEYVVRARVLAFKELPKGWPEAKIRGPYDMSHMEMAEEAWLRV